MRLPYPVEYYEEKLKDEFKQSYEIIPLSEWHGLRTDVRIFCHKHRTFRNVYLKKVFNGKKSTKPCRKCYLESLTENITE